MSINESTQQIAGHVDTLTDALYLEGTKKEDAVKKYAIREFLQIIYNQQIPEVTIPVNTNSERLQSLFLFGDWYRRNMGVDINYMDSENIKRLLYTNDFPHEFINSSYFVNPYSPEFLEETKVGDHALKPNENMSIKGMNPSEAEIYKDKGNFNTELAGNSDRVGIGNSGDPDKNFAIPHQIIELGSENIAKEVGERMDEIDEMYNEIYNHNSQLVFPNTGVVLRPSKRDGGIGNLFFIHNGGTGEYEVHGDGQRYIGEEDEDINFSDKSEALKYLQRLMRKEGVEYVMTRFCDVSHTPSVGLIANDSNDFKSLPVTTQEQKGNTTIGGSAGFISNEFDNDIRTYSEEIVKQLVKENTNGRAHIGIDWMIMGEVENNIIDTICQDESLKSKYGKEFARKVAVEMNPRDTLISGVTTQLLRQMKLSQIAKENNIDISQVVENLRDNKLSPEELQKLVITLDDYENLYKSGFWVHDTIEYAGDSTDNEDNTAELLAFIERFNNDPDHKGNVVMIPRFDVFDKEYKEGDVKKSKKLCSVSVAAMNHIGREKLINFVNTLQNDYSDQHDGEDGYRIDFGQNLAQAA